MALVSGCASVGAYDDIPQTGVIKRSITWVLTDDPAAMCKERFGQNLIGTRVACASVSGSTCTIYVKPPRSEDDRNAIYILGHEALHCFTGNFHYPLH